MRKEEEGRRPQPPTKFHDHTMRVEMPSIRSAPRAAEKVGKREIDGEMRESTGLAGGGVIHRNR